MSKGNKDSLDLIVERFEICTYRQDFPNSSEAILEAARLADTILYINIYGALQFDGLVPGWDGEIKYPVLP